MRKIIFNSNNNIRPIWRIFLFLLITFLINIPLQLGLQKVFNQSFLRGYISGSIYLVCVILSLFIQIKYIDKSSFKKYGLKINKAWRHEFFVGFQIAFLLLTLFFTTMYLTGNLEVVGYFTTKSSDYSFIEGFISESFGLIIGATVEEIFFRSFLFYVIYEALRKVKKDSTKRAFLVVIATSLIFGITHFANESATVISSINLCLYGMMVCLPFLITGRLGMSIGFHFSWNLVQGAVYGFPISGNIAKASIMSIEFRNNLLTGGAFGAEGSMLFILLVVIGVMLILYWKNLKNYNSFVSPCIIKNDINITR